MKPCMVFPRADHMTALHTLVLHMDREWPSEGKEKAEMAEAVRRHIEKDGLSRAAQRTEKSVSDRLRDLADGIQRTEAMVDGLKR